MAYQDKTDDVPRGGGPISGKSANEIKKGGGSISGKDANENSAETIQATPTNTPVAEPEPRPRTISNKT